MAKLVYSAMASLDGFIADEAGRFDWAAPDEEVHRFINNLELRIGTFLFGRRMYEVMAVWETLDASPGLPRRACRGECASFPAVAPRTCWDERGVSSESCISNQITPARKMRTQA